MVRVLRHISPRSTPEASNPPPLGVFSGPDGRTHRIDSQQSPGRAADQSSDVAREMDLLEAIEECHRMVCGAVESTSDDTRDQRVECHPVQPRQDAALRTDRPATSNTSRVQLRLSSRLVRILRAFKGAGRHPSQIVESALWQDSRIRDAATILHVDPIDSDA